MVKVMNKNSVVNKYIKKRVIVEAVQWLGDNYSEISKFMGKLTPFDMTDSTLIIGTLEGDMRANIGDYIIKGVHGEFYPCKPDIFFDNFDRYEEVNYE